MAQIPTTFQTSTECPNGIGGLPVQEPAGFVLMKKRSRCGDGVAEELNKEGVNSGADLQASRINSLEECAMRCCQTEGCTLEVKLLIRDVNDNDQSSMIITMIRIHQLHDDASTKCQTNFGSKYICYHLF
jgi:hypothetical protein